MKKFELYGLILFLVFFYFLILGLLTWKLQLGLIAITIFGYLYTKYMIKWIDKYQEEHK